MKKFIGLVLIGLLIRHGLADVSHLFKHNSHNHNGYLPPLQPAVHNLFIEQDNNVINSQHQSGFDNENRGYLPPYEEHSQHHHNHVHHHHQHTQQEERGYLPPLLEKQEQIHQNIHNEQLDKNLGYLPPSVEAQSHHGQEKHENHHNHEEDRGYLPPHQEQFEHHVHHHSTQQDTVEPNLQISHYNNYAVSLQPKNFNHYHSKESISNDEIEDNSNGYNYSPPKHSFEEEYQHHRIIHQEDSLIGGPEPAVDVVETSENSQEVHHHSSEESHTESDLKQNLVPPNNSNLEHQSEEPHQQVTQDYLPPISSSHEHLQTHLNQAEQEDNFPPQSNFQIQGNEESHEGDERGYLPPIGALELPQSSDTLHIVPPTKLGLPIQKSKAQHETNHINVPLPIPQAGYYFIPAVVTKLPSLAQEIKTEHLSSVSNISPIGSHQIHNHQQHYQQQQLSINEIPPAEYSRPLTSGFRIIPSIQTAQEIASQGYLTPSQVVAHELQHFADIGIQSPNLNSNHHEFGQHIFPPLTQTQQQQDQFVIQQQLKQNLNEVQNTHQHQDQSQSSFDNFVKFSNQVVSNEQNQINRQLELSNQQENAYLPPIDDNNYQQQQAFQNENQVNCGDKQSEAEIHNQVTNLQTNMDNVNLNDSPSLKFSKPSAIEANAPGMAYKVSTKVPFNSFTQAGYLPPSAGTSKSEESQPEYSSSIGLELNEEAKKDIAQQTGRDNTIFPLADIPGTQNDEMSQIIEQLQGHISTIQITNHNDKSVKNIKVRDSSNQTGERTIEILGQSKENPIGEHKVLHVISKVPNNPRVVDHTIKFFNDNREVAKPTSNDYLPPSKTDKNLHKLRRRY